MTPAYKSSALEDSATVASRTSVEEVVVTYTGAADKFLHIFDAQALPANGTVPDLCIQLKAGTTVFWDPTESSGSSSFDGIVVAVSTTAATLTVDTANEALFYVRGS